MFRAPWVWLLGALLAQPAAAQAADTAPAGTWKVVFFAPDQQVLIGLLKLESKNNKWQGAITAKSEQFEEATITVGRVQVTGGDLQITLKVQNQTWTIEGKVKDPKTILGSAELPGRGGAPFVIPVRLEATTLKALDRFALAQETLAKHGDRPAAFDATLALVREAAARKVKPEQVKQWANRACRLAEGYGPRWQRDLTQRLAEALVNQDGMADVALDYARKAEKLLDPRAGAAAQMRALQLLVTALRKAKKSDDVKKYEVRIAGLEGKVYEEYVKKSLPFKPEVFAGRKGKSTRVVLIELFTGAQCPPCVAADLAFDALGKTYQPREVVLLQYHLHIPQPDVLTNPDSESRRKYYIDDIEGTPSIFFNGKFDAAGGGSVNEAREKYGEYRKIIDPLLEKAAPVKLTLRAVRKGQRIEITAETAGLEKPGEKMRLRLVLVERWVKYAGANRLPYHHHVVRALPGGANGLALTRQNSRHTATVDLPQLRKDLAAYLKNFAEKKKPFRDDQQPLELRNLSVVGFVQNDENKEVLQAAETRVDGGEAKGEGE